MEICSIISSGTVDVGFRVESDYFNHYCRLMFLKNPINVKRCDHNVL